MPAPSRAPSPPVRGPSRPSAASTSTSRPARSSASSARTAPGRPPRCACSRLCSAPTSGTAQVAGHDLLRDPVGVRRRIGYVAQGGVTLPQARAGEEVVDQARLYGVPTAAGDAPRAGAVRPARPRGPVGPALRVALRRPAPPARHRHGPGPLARPGLPRRAHHRARPAVPREPVGAHPQPARPPRRHGLPHDPLPRRGRRPLRPPAGDRQRRHRRRRDVGGAQARRVGGRRHPHPQGGAGRRRRAADRRGAARRPGAAKRAVGDGTAQVQVRVPNGGAALPGLLRTLDARGISPDAVEVRRPTLDDVFLSLTGRSLRDAA